jgi:ABC-2 type transport system permease protein
MAAISARRISAVVYRHIVGFRQSPLELVEVLYVPALQMLVWGFTATYVTSHVAPGAGARTFGFSLVIGFLLWEMTLRSQVGVSGAFLEETWSRNLTHILASPLRPAEFVVGLIGVSLVRTALGIIPAALLAWLVYGYSLARLGPALVLLVLNLLVMGWWLALAVLAVIVRFGSVAQGFASSLTITLTPLAVVFYPLHVLPGALQAVASLLPAAHVFEALRVLAEDGTVSWDGIGWAALANLAWTVVMSGVLTHQLRRARRRGSLASINE